MSQDRLSADVLVVGAGAAGLPAAIGAARAGAQVVLVEEDPVVGGAPSDYYVCLLYGGPITGVLAELHARLREKHSPVPGAQFFLPGAYQHAWGELLRAEPNLTLLTGAQAREARTAEVGGRRVVTGARVEAVGGRSLEIEAKVVIDCTGSGAVALAAGGRARYGREAQSEFGEPSAPEQADDRVQALTWMYFVQRLPGANPVTEGLPLGVSVRTGIRPRGHTGPWPNEEAQRNPDAGLYLQWGCAVPCRDTRDRLEVARSQQHAREVMAPDHALLHEHGYLVYPAPRIGVREASRIVGEYTITENDVRAGLFPDDTIALADYGLDVWRPREAGDRGGTVSMFDLPAARYGIPYRTLLPAGVDGLLVAGMCMSGTHIAQSSFRVQPIVASAGQAAGVAAALAARHRTQPRGIDPDDVRRLLRSPAQHVQLSFDEPQE